MISVIMSVYNERLDWIRKSVSSVLDQTYTDFEYIIIIDNPNLNNGAVPFLEKVAEHDSRVRLHFNEKNMGLMRSLNVGIEMARGEYIARMDADDISFLDRFEKELIFLSSNEYDMVSANRVDIDEDGNEILRTIHIKNNPEKHLPYSNFIVHPSVMIRTDVMKTLGGYRDFYNSEDYDMWLRLLSAGYRIGILEDYVIYYRIRQTGMSLKNKLEAYYITKYQQKLYWERVNTGRDSFSEKNFKSYMTSKNISERGNKRYCKFRSHMDKAILLFKSKNVSFFPAFIRAFFVFPSMAIQNVSDIIHMR